MKKKENSKFIRSIIWHSSLYTLGSIAGPLVVFGGAGWLLDQYFNSRPLCVLIGIGIAFVFTNVFLFKKVKYLNKQIEEEGKRRLKVKKKK